MVATTATQLLRYPQVSDAPCDGDLHIGYLAADIEAKLNSHDADLARTLLPPAFIASLTPGVYPLDGVVGGLGVALFEMDAVQHQVGGTFVNLAANPKIFSVPRLGTYQVTLEVGVDSFGDNGGAEYQFFLTKYPTLPMQVQTQHVNKQEGIEYLTVTGLIRVSTITDAYLWMGLPGGNIFLDSDMTIAEGKVSAFWVSD